MVIERIRRIVMKEFIQTLRDRRMRFFLFVPPIMQLLVFGTVVTTDVNDIRTSLRDLDRTTESRELVRRLEAAGYFTVVARPESDALVRDLMDRGDVTCAVQIDPGFGRDVQRRHATSVQVLIDGTDSNTATVALSYAARIVTQYSLDTGMPQGGIAPRAVEFRRNIWYNPDLKSRNYNVPGVMASIIMLVSLMLTSMAVVRERELGTMEQLMVSPLSPAELMLGKTIPFAVIGVADMILVTAVGALVFSIPIRGSLVLLFCGTLVYLLSVLGIGLFISTVARTQQQALMATMFFYMPAMLLSGFVFPVENMPPLFQYLTLLNPFRYFLVIIRGIFLKGAGMDVLWPQMAALLILGVAVITLSAARFRKRLK